MILVYYYENINTHFEYKQIYLFGSVMAKAKFLHTYSKNGYKCYKSQNLIPSVLCDFSLQSPLQFPFETETHYMSPVGLTFNSEFSLLSVGI